MTEKQYVDSIIKRLSVTGQRKKDIRQQLLAEIEMRLEQGENREDIFLQMGTAAEVAENFNETTSDAERKKYKRNKIFKIVIPIVFVIAALVCLLYWFLPKGRAIEDSSYFTKDRVEAAIIDTITLLDQEDYTSLCQEALPQMQSALNKEVIDGVKANIHENWGERTQIGTIYMQELIQKGEHYAIGQVTVTYENTVVTYTITYNQDMKLSGLYLK